MATSTQSFDEIFLTRLEDLLAERYPTLELQAQAPGFRFGAPRSRETWS